MGSDSIDRVQWSLTPLNVELERSIESDPIECRSSHRVHTRRYDHNAQRLCQALATNFEDHAIVCGYGWGDSRESPAAAASATCTPAAATRTTPPAGTAGS